MPGSAAIKLKSACRKPDLSLSGLDPVPLLKIGTRLLASLGSKGKNRNSLACLRNAGFHSAVTYCKQRVLDRVLSPKYLTRPAVTPYYDMGVSKPKIWLIKSVAPFPVGGTVFTDKPYRS